METLFLFFQIIPMFFVVGYAVAASYAKNDLKAIKYLMWTIAFLLASIAYNVI